MSVCGIRGEAIKPSAFLMYKEIGTFLPFINHSILGKQFEACVGNLTECRILGDTSTFFVQLSDENTQGRVPVLQAQSEQL